MRPLTERRVVHVRNLGPPRVLDLPRGRGKLHARALQVDLSRPPTGVDAERHRGARRALDLRDRHLIRGAGNRVAVDTDDHVPLLHPGGLGGAVGEHAGHTKPTLDPCHGQPDAREVPRGRAVELAQLMGVEIVREAVAVPLLDLVEHPVDRGVVEHRVGDRLEVVLLDRVAGVRSGAGGGAEAAREPDDHQRDRGRRQRPGGQARDVPTPVVGITGASRAAQHQRPCSTLALGVKRGGSGAERCRCPAPRRRPPRPGA